MTGPERPFVLCPNCLQPVDALDVQVTIIPFGAEGPDEGQGYVLETCSDACMLEWLTDTA